MSNGVIENINELKQALQKAIDDDSYIELRAYECGLILEKFIDFDLFIKEWSDRFGFLATNNPRESINSIDEVADILSSKTINQSS